MTLLALTLLVAAVPATVPTLTDAQKAFLDLPRAERRALFADPERRARLAEAGDRPRPATVAVDNLEIGRDYTCVILDASGREVSRRAFRTEDRAPRLLRIDGVANARDLGGRRGLGGRRVRQGRVFRSGQYEDARDVFFVTNTLGVKTDIDLRDLAECGRRDGSPLGPNVVRHHLPFVMYGELAEPRGRKAMADVFRLFLDERNYPIGFHCVWGKDRTGAVAFVLNALLGVEEEELYRDWEASGFVISLPKFRHAERFDRLVAVFAAYPGETINARVEGYVRSLGFTERDIAKFRELMLE